MSGNKSKSILVFLFIVISLSLVFLSYDVLNQNLSFDFENSQVVDNFFFEIEPKLFLSSKGSLRADGFDIENPISDFVVKDYSLDKIPDFEIFEGEFLEFRVDVPQGVGQDINWSVEGLPREAGFFEVPAFPGAEGFGARTTGGRGGEVVKVTNLNNSGVGSFRWALEQEGPKIIVFDVAGLIETSSNPINFVKSKDLFFQNRDDITIAGQTAPSPGVTVYGSFKTDNTDNLIMRFLRSRIPFPKGFEGDSFRILHSHNVILDHLSGAWGTDEGFQISHDLRYLTIQWSGVEETDMRDDGEYTDDIDVDLDGILDQWELIVIEEFDVSSIYEVNPEEDLDNDGVSNLDEFLLKSNPINSSAGNSYDSFWDLNFDEDSDGIADWYERKIIKTFGEAVYASYKPKSIYDVKPEDDPDRDGWGMLEEYEHGSVTHPRGDVSFGHNYGMLLGYGSKDGSIHHNFFTHHIRRSPVIQSEIMDFRNNVIYNCGSGTHFYQTSGIRSGRMGLTNLIGNYYKVGPSDLKEEDDHFYPSISSFIALRDDSFLFLENNFFDFTTNPRGFLDVTDSNRRLGLFSFVLEPEEFLKEFKFPAPNVKTQDVLDSYDLVLAHSGTLPRDSITARNIEEIRTRTGSFVGKHNNSRDYFFSNLSFDSVLVDSDDDGMSDVWELRHGLNPNDYSDHNRKVLSSESVLTYKGEDLLQTRDRYKGYTFIEYYINERADVLILDALIDSGLSLNEAILNLPGFGEEVKPTFSWRPDFDQRGEYDIVLKGTDGVRNFSKSFRVSVKNYNRHPVITPSNYGEVSPVIEGTSRFKLYPGQTSIVKVRARDDDGDEYMFDISKLPENSKIVDTNSLVNDKNGQYDEHEFIWTPKSSQVGVHNVEFVVNDGEFSFSKVVKFEVLEDPGSCNSMGGEICLSEHTKCSGIFELASDSPFCCIGSCFCENDDQCDDGNVCTNEFCNAKGKCEVTFNNKPCDDGFLCTSGDFCQQGSCVSGAREDLLCVKGYDSCSRAFCNPDLFPDNGCGGFLPSGCAKTQGLVLWHNYDGDFFDLSGKNFHGVCDEELVCPSFGLDRENNVNSSVVFDGVDDFLRVSSANEFNSKFYTVMFWINSKKSFNPATFILSRNFRGNVNNLGAHVTFEEFGIVGTNYPSCSNCCMKGLENQWVHLTAVRNGTNASFYLNGSFVGSEETEFVEANALDLLIGARHIHNAPYEDFFLNGSLDDLRIFSRALSSKEIDEIVNPVVLEPSVCGNSKMEAGEWCDGDDLNGDVCLDYGFFPGELNCLDDCSYVNSSNCGDKIPCSFDDVFFEIEHAVENQSVNLFVNGSFCDGKEVIFEVFESSGVFEGLNISLLNQSSFFSNGIAQMSWDAVWRDNLSLDPVFKFRAILVENESVSVLSRNNLTSHKIPLPCVDSDFGKKYFSRGSCQDDLGVYFDDIVEGGDNDGFLREYFCDNNLCVFEEVECEFGALDNFCRIDWNLDFTAYFDFNDNFLDLSSNGFEGKAFGNTSISDNGVYGRCALFDGVSDFIEVAHSPLLENENYSLVAWVRPEDFSPSQGNYILTKNNICMYLRFDHFGGCGGGYPLINHDFGEEDKLSWHMLTQVREGNLMKFFIDNEFVGDFEITSNFSYGNAVLTIGGRGLYLGFNGSIDEVMIFNRSLRENEVLKIYNKFVSNDCTDLDGDGFSVEGGSCGKIDCDDFNEFVFLGADEICDGIDNQCFGDDGFGRVDEGCARVFKGQQEIKLKNYNWPDSSDMKSFALDAIRLMNASTDQQKALAVYQAIKMFTSATDGKAPSEIGLGDNYIDDPLKILNVYGAHWCDGLARVAEITWRALGFRAEKTVKGSHTQVSLFYNDSDGVFRDHLFDMSLGWFVFTRDGERIASRDDIARDFSLVLRPSKSNLIDGFSYHDLDGSFFTPHLDFPSHDKLLSLRRGEVFTRFAFDKFLPYQNNFRVLDKNVLHGPYEIIYGSSQRVLESSFNFSGYQDLFVRPTSYVSSVVNDGIRPNLHPSFVKKKSVVLFEVKSPYIISDAFFVGDFYRKSSNDSIKVFISTDDGLSWKQVYSHLGVGDDLNRVVNFTQKFNPEDSSSLPEGLISPFGRYDYLIKIEMIADKQIGDVGVNAFKVNTNFQHNLFSMPVLLPGDNLMRVEASGSDALVINYVWEDLSGIRVSEVYVEDFPFEFNLTTNANVWEDVVIKNISYKVVESDGLGNRFLKIEPKVVSNQIKFKDLFNVIDTLGVYQVPQLKSAQVYLSNLDSRVDVLNSLSGLIVLDDFSTYSKVRDFTFKERDHKFKELGIQAMFLIGKENSYQDLIKIIRKDEEVLWRNESIEHELGHYHFAGALASFLLADANYSLAVSDVNLLLENIYDSGAIYETPIIACLRAIEKFADNSSVDIVKKFLSYGNYDVKTSAIKAIGELGVLDLDIKSNLHVKLEGGLYFKQYPIYGLYSAEALAKLGDQSIVSDLYFMLNMSDENFRGVASEALGFVGNSSSIDFLMMAFENESFDWVKENIEVSIDKLGGVLQNCSSQGGFVCGDNSFCPGSKIFATDSNRCCDMSCEEVVFDSCNKCSLDLLFFSKICSKDSCLNECSKDCFFLEKNKFCGDCLNISCSNYSDDILACEQDFCGLNNCEFFQGNCRDICVPFLVNSSWSSWSNVSCLKSNVWNQSSFLTQFDNNFCGKVEDKVFYKFRKFGECNFSLWKPSFVLNFSNFDMNFTTNFSKFSKEELQSLRNISFKNKKFKSYIKFLDVINVSRNLNFSRKNLRFGRDFVDLNSRELFEFNKSARIFFENISFLKPKVLMNGFDCPSSVCLDLNFNKSFKKFSFVVKHFSNFSVVESSVCGDNVCDDFENCLSCAVDCGSCSSGSGGSGGSGGGGSSSGGGSSGGSGSGSSFVSQNNENLNNFSSILENQNQCESNFKCYNWSNCVNNKKSRICLDLNNCSQDERIEFLDCFEIFANNNSDLNKSYEILNLLRNELAELYVDINNFNNSFYLINKSLNVSKEFYVFDKNTNIVYLAKFVEKFDEDFNLYEFRKDNKKSSKIQNFFYEKRFLSYLKFFIILFCLIIFIVLVVNFYRKKEQMKIENLEKEESLELKKQIEYDVETINIEKYLLANKDKFSMEILKNQLLKHNYNLEKIEKVIKKIEKR